LESKLISERSRYELETYKSPLAADRKRPVGSTSEEPLSEEKAEKAEQEKMTVKMTCSKCGLTGFKSDMELNIHRDEKHNFESRVTDAFGQASLPIGNAYTKALDNLIDKVAPPSWLREKQ
jgi:hypothetical protein